jgi:hypothetical protein
MIQENAPRAALAIPFWNRGDAMAFQHYAHLEPQLAQLADRLLIA